MKFLRINSLKCLLTVLTIFSLCLLSNLCLLFRTYEPFPYRLVPAVITPLTSSYRGYYPSSEVYCGSCLSSFSLSQFLKVIFDDVVGQGSIEIGSFLSSS